MELLDPIQLREVDSRDRLKYMSVFLICRLAHISLCVVGIAFAEWNYFIMYCSILGTLFYVMAVYLAWRWDVGTPCCLPSCISPQRVVAMAMVIDSGLVAMTRVDVQRALARSLNSDDQLFGNIASLQCDELQTRASCGHLLHWQSQTTTQIFQFIIFYLMVFVLTDSQSLPIGGLCVLVYSAISLAASFNPESKVELLSRIDLHILMPAYAISVIAKYKMVESKKLLIDVLEKQKNNVVQEKVLRCQAEFTCEQLACHATGHSRGCVMFGAQDATAHADPDDTIDAVSELLLASDDGNLTQASSYPETATDSAAAFKDLAKELSQNHLSRIATLAVREHWYIPSKDLKLDPDKVLGSGSFGIVHAASYLGTPAAVKLSKLLRAPTLNVLVNEMRILRRIRHPNIVLFYGACIDPLMLTVSLVLEQVDGKRLDLFRASMHQASVAHCRHIVNSICCAISYMHGQCPAIVHGDLKPSNIMVHSEGSSARPHVKILDFGLSRLLTKTVESLGGTVAWMAPEVLSRQSQTPTPSADVFSTGRISYFVFIGELPVGHLSHRSLKDMAAKGNVPPLEWPEREELQEFRNLVNRCVEFKADSRPTIFEFHAALTLLELRVSGSDGAVSGIPRQLSDTVELGAVAAGGDNVLAHLKPTSFHAKSISIAKALQHWNVTFRRESCCAWHAALQELQIHGQHLMREDCWESFPSSAQWQCSECGWLNDDPYCCICDSKDASSSLASIRASTPCVSL